MCFILATYYLTDRHIDIVLNEWKSNPDGGGIAYLERKKEKTLETTKYTNELIVEKGIMKKEDLRKRLKKQLGKTVVAHVRYATHGDKDAANTHPFWTCNREAVMFHNGILPSPFSSSTEVSDSRMMANTLNMLQFHDVVRDSNEIGEAIGWNKLVFLSKDGYLHIVNAECGEWLSKGSVWVSQRLTNFARTYDAPRKHYTEPKTMVEEIASGWYSEGKRLSELSDEEYDALKWE